MNELNKAIMEAWAKNEKPEEYEDEEVKVLFINGKYETYKNVEYKSPYKWKETKGFLHCATWKKEKDLFSEYDGLGFRTGRTAGSLEEIADTMRRI